MGPKTFVECYVCFKEFGSRSFPFHEPKCLEKWRNSNKNLPAEKRASTPVKPANWKYSQISFWICSHCQVTIPFAKKNQHISSCSAKKLQSNNRSQRRKMTGVVKADFSPKRGKENKNISNHIPTLSVLKKNAKNEAKVVNKDTPNTAQADDDAKRKENPKQPQNVSDAVISDDVENFTSKRALRPQTKILRRPTPNLNHPVIQVDSDDSSADSSCSDKGKEDNPKRLKMGESATDTTHKTKNFIMYNKNNVDKNTKNTPKERTSAAIASLIPNPCNSCNRSQQPERLHSHARKDARGLMNRRSPASDVKMGSPQKKPSDNSDKIKSKSMDTKTVNSADCNMSKSPSSSDNISSLKTKETLKKVSSESCLAVVASESDKDDEKNVLEPTKSCYICQESIKISNLLLHESQCLESWKKTNNSLTPNLRKLPPRRPDDDEIPDENDPAWTTLQSQLIPCPLCSRTFFPERLPVHRRVCKGKPSPRSLKRASSMREQSASSRNGDEQRLEAVYVPCYICSRNFGSWVITMHEQQCLRKWRRENEKLPDEEQQEEPQKIPGFLPDNDVSCLVELGDSAWESHLQQLVPCPLCSRTFFPNRLAVHKRSCKGMSSNTRPRSNKAT